jgi:hypothetical protein
MGGSVNRKAQNRRQKNRRIDNRVREGDNQVSDRADHREKLDNRAEWVAEEDEDRVGRGKRQDWYRD